MLAPTFSAWRAFTPGPNTSAPRRAQATAARSPSSPASVIQATAPRPSLLNAIPGENGRSGVCGDAMSRGADHGATAAGAASASVARTVGEAERITTPSTWPLARGSGFGTFGV
jgi:hypothetical protein